jgi:hypothetical protein
MHPPRLILLIAACAAASGPLPGEGRTRNALALLDAFVAAAARDRPGLRADVRPAGNSQAPPPGRALAFSANLGPFTYRPRTWAELTGADRAALLRDGGLREFLAANAAGVAPIPTRNVSLSADEMLRLGPAIVRLPPPAGTP